MLRLIDAATAAAAAAAQIKRMKEEIDLGIIWKEKGEKSVQAVFPLIKIGEHRKSSSSSSIEVYGQ